MNAEQIDDVVRSLAVLEHLPSNLREQERTLAYKNRQIESLCDFLEDKGLYEEWVEKFKESEMEQFRGNDPNAATGKDNNGTPI